MTTEIIKGALIGVHKHVNAEDKREFRSLSFRTGNAEISSLSINDPVVAAQIEAAHAKARANGKTMVFEIANATKVEATQNDPQTGLETQVRGKGGDLYFRIAGADIGTRPSLKFHAYAESDPTIDLSGADL